MEAKPAGNLPYLIVGLLLTIGFRAHADVGAVESDSSLGKQTFIEDIFGNGKFDHPDKNKDIVWNWNLGFTSTKAISQDPTNGKNITDTTRDIAFGFGLKTPKHFGADLGYDYANTPDEHLTQRGPNLGVSYTYVFNSAKKSKASAKSDDPGADEPFHPDLGARLGFASEDYVQVFGVGFAGRRAGVLRPVIGQNTITQKAPSLTFSSSPLPWLSLKLGFTNYSYNKDPNLFLAYLDSTRVLRNQSTGMSTIVTGLPKNETLLQASFDLSDDWSLLLYEVVAISAEDGSKAYTTRIIAAKDLNDAWNLAFGIENDKSDTVKDNLLLINVRYMF